MVACANKGAPPPKELVLVWDIERWGTLPEGGGLFDQDAKTMHTSRVVQAIYKTLARLKNMKGAQIHSLTDGERKIIGSLQDEGYM